MLWVPDALTSSAVLLFQDYCQRRTDFMGSWAHRTEVKRHIMLSLVPHCCTSGQ
jgi:hypothetical protein